MIVAAPPIVVVDPLVIDPQWSLIIAALATVFTAVGGLVLAFSVLLPTLRASKDAVVKVAEVHTLVNSAHDALLQYQSQLVGALRDNDVAVPTDETHRPAEAHPSGPEPPRLGLPDQPGPEHGLIQ